MNIKTTHQRILIIIVTIFAMTLALFNTGVVFAQDDQPPLEPVGTEEPIATDVPVATPEPVVIDIPVLPVDTTSNEQPIATDVPTAAPELVFTEETGVQEIFEQIPSEMQVVAINEEGQPEPLVTQQAAEIIVTSDPMWCPTGQIPGDAGCTAGYTTVSELITALNGVTGNGTIYFTSSYTTNDLIFDHVNADLAGLDALTIQGGWNGSTGNAFALSGSTTFDGVGLIINNWANAVTINDIIVDGASGTGISVFTTGNIVLSNIQANNSSHGVTLVNENSTVVFNGINSFNNNQYLGLVINSQGGDVYLNNITANENGNTGALINSCEMTSGSGCIESGSVTLAGTNVFNNNGDLGLVVVSESMITINNITANGNGSTGVLLDNCRPCNGPHDIILTGTNTFNNNLEGGLHVVSSGDFIMTGASAFSNNYGNGLFAEAYGDITITCAEFENNGQYGIIANSHTLTLNGVNFSGNLGGDFRYSSGPWGELIIHPGCKAPTVNNIMSGVSENGVNGSLSGNLVNVVSGQFAELNCELYSGTKLILPNGDSFSLPCPLGDSVSLTTNTRDALPGPLPENNIFQSAFTASVTENGESLNELNTSATVSFVIPASAEISNLAILYWDGTQWVEVDAFSNGESHLEALVNYTGIFALVSR